MSRKLVGAGPPVKRRGRSAIYALVDRDGEVFYVGYSGDWHARVQDHLRDAIADGDKPRHETIRALWRAGLKPRAILVERLEEGATPWLTRLQHAEREAYWKREFDC